MKEYLYSLQKHLRVKVHEDQDGVYVEFNSDKLLDFTYFDSGKSASLYFSPNNNFDIPYKSDDRATAHGKLRKIVDDYLSKGAIITEIYRGKHLVARRLTIGDAEETELIGFWLGSRKRVIKQIPPPAIRI